MPSPRNRPLNADDKMPWGEFAGKRMGDLPVEYLDFLIRQPWLKDWPGIHQYISAKRAFIESSRPKQIEPKVLNTYDDYIRWARKQ